MSVGFCITFKGLLTRRYIEQTPERVIGLLKLYLAQSLEGKWCYMMEMATLLGEVVKVVNSNISPA
jgi:hypothetical protein